MTARGAAVPGATLGKCRQFGMSEQIVIVQGVLRGNEADQGHQESDSPGHCGWADPYADGKTDGASSAEAQHDLKCV